MIRVDDDDDDDDDDGDVDDDLDAEDDDRLEYFGGMSQFQWFNELLHSESVDLIGTNSAKIDQLT